MKKLVMKILRFLKLDGLLLGLIEKLLLGLSKSVAAWKEAARCMRCYRILTVVTKAPIPGSAA